jgi:hypothetical protein
MSNLIIPSAITSLDKKEIQQLAVDSANALLERGHTVTIGDVCYLQKNH